MRMMVKLAFHYIRYYKSRTWMILGSIIMIAALLSMVNIFQHSGRLSEIETARKRYGDYQFILFVNQETALRIKRDAEKLHLEKLGEEKFAGEFNTPRVYYLSSVDEGYLETHNLKLSKGRMPQAEDEVAMEEWMLKKWEMGSELNQTVTIKQGTFRLVGILGERPLEISWGWMTPYIFCSESVAKKQDVQYSLFLKFYESVDIMKEYLKLKNDYGIETDADQFNGPLLESMGVSLSEMKNYYGNEIGAKVSQWFMKLQYNTFFIILLTGLFAGFLIYGIYNLSIVQRTKDFGVMKATGAGEGRLSLLLFTELAILLLIGYPIGCLLGVGLAKALYPHFSGIFNELDARVLQMEIPFHLFGTAFLLLLLLFLFVVFLIVKQIGRGTVLQAIQKTGKETKRKESERKIYSIRYRNMTNVVILKNIVRRKSVFISVLLSLSLGGMILLVTDYIGEQTRKNYNFTMKADDGLSSDYELEVKNLDFLPGIPEEKAEELAKSAGIQSVHPVRYYLGGLLLGDEKLKYKDYFENVPIEELTTYGGIWTKEKEPGQNLLKVGVYGYDDDMIEKLKEREWLEGDKDSPLLQNGTGVLLRIPPGGAENYDCLDLHPGDKIRMKYQKQKKADKMLMKFPLEESYQNEYEIKEFVITGVVKSFMAVRNDDVDYYKIGGAGVIMKNENFKGIFGVSDYKIISVIKSQEADPVQTSSHIRNVASDVKDCVVADHATDLMLQNRQLQSQLLFVYGIMTAVFAVNFFHMTGSIGNLLLSRKSEFAVLRAMGITDKKFWFMIIKEGMLYGILSSVIMVIGALVGQWGIYRLLNIVYRYQEAAYSLNISLYLCMTGINILLSIFAVVIPCRQLLKTNIAESVSRTE